jgi:hypothetical protein
VESGRSRVYLGSFGDMEVVVGRLICGEGCVDPVLDVAMRL